MPSPWDLGFDAYFLRCEGVLFCSKASKVKFAMNSVQQVIPGFKGCNKGNQVELSLDCKMEIIIHCQW